VKSEAQAVVVGGGIVGCSTAYHLADMGWKDIVVVEKGDLTSGSTWHAAGLVGQLRGSASLTRIMRYSADLYARLGKETGHDPEWRQVGSMRLASTPLRMEENLRQAAMCRTFGLPVEVLSPREAVNLFPLMSDRDLVGALFMPTDGRVDPSGATLALARGARARGVEFYTNTRVTAINVKNGRVEAVVTDHGVIRAPVVVNAAGMWADQVGRMVGVTLPLITMQHQYLITEPVEGMRRDLPILRDPDLRVYLREEVLGLLVGGFEATPKPWALDGVPLDFSHRLLQSDWPLFEPLARAAARRVPAFEHAEVTRLINGPEAFTPDGEFMAGEVPGVRGFFVAAGFNAYGIAAGGGVGRVLAEWIVEGQPSLDLWRMDVRRWGPQYQHRAYTLPRSIEALARRYGAVSLPYEEWDTGRGYRLSPVYDRLQALGASLGEKGGWERPNWFASNAADGGAGSAADGWRPAGFLRHNWTPAIAAEHLATRQAAGLFDFSSFSKIEVEGPGALRALQWLSDNEMNKPVGSVTYTQMLNPRGGIECDLTVTRLAPDRFFIITGSAFGAHDLDWIRRHLPADGSAVARDVTTALACIGLWGPQARAILERCTGDDVSNAGFPYMTGRTISVAGIRVRALRVTYVGELGWELYMPAEQGAIVWDALWDAGRAFGLRPVGYRAVESLRLEKGYRYWSADITPEYTPLESGQAFCVRLDKGDFQGRDALVRQKAEGLTRRLCCLVLAEPTAVALGNEPVFEDGRVVGRVTSGGYGFSVRESIAYAYLPVRLATIGARVTVEADGERIGATVQREPRFDPANIRVKS
jgi:4-methylaminobutanoate oxidase (formaldehyde-forming)